MKNNNKLEKDCFLYYIDVPYVGVIITLIGNFS